VSHQRPQVRQVAVFSVRSIPHFSVRSSLCPRRRHHHGPIMGSIILLTVGSAHTVSKSAEWSSAKRCGGHRDPAGVDHCW
jgi:hypothetical protein